MRINRAASLFLSIALLASVVVGYSTTASAAGNPNCNAVDGDYIVSFNKGVNVDGEIKSAPGRAVAPKFKYKNVLNGFAATLSAEQVCAFQKRPNIQFVEKDAVVSADGAQSSPTWGLNRIDQRALPLDSTYNYVGDGSGVYAYIIDTGILTTHSEFGARATTGGFSAINDGKGTTDCNGHGTHVAGTVGGSTYGVAKNVNLVPVRVLDCNGSGTNIGVIAGIDWVASNRVKPAVANLSLGGGLSAALNSAIANLVVSGVTVVVAAGNNNANACNYSPASEPTAITVGATTITDARASYSNFGTCLDIFAPGSSITSSWYTSTTAISTIGGTSMASPHVAGVAALFLSRNTSATPAGVSGWMATNGTPNAVTSAGLGSANLLLANDYLSPVSLTKPTFTTISGTSPKRATASVSWSVSNGGSQIQDYVVTLKRNGAVISSVTITTSSSSGSYTFSRVSSGAGYSVTVVARNGVGSSEATTPTFTVN